MKPHGYWQHPANVKDFADAYVRDHLDGNWYNISFRHVRAHGGATLMKLYGGSAQKFAMDMEPSLLPWLFTCVPIGFWQEDDNVRKYSAWLLSEKLNGNWYNINNTVVAENGGLGLLGLRFKNSSVLLAMWNDALLLPWKFQTTPRGYWDDDVNVRAYGQWLLTNVLGNNWYNITAKLVHEHHGETLIAKRFNHSATELACFMDDSLLPWKFCSTRKWFWNDDDNVMRFGNHLLKLVNGNHLLITAQLMIEEGAQHLLMHRFRNSVRKFIQLCWPEVFVLPGGVSLESCQCMERIMVELEAVGHTVYIQHALNGGEVVPEHTKYKVDGFCNIDAGNIAFEYHGCHYHGCPKCFSDETKTNVYDKPYGKLLETTERKQTRLEELGWIVIPIWACEWKECLSSTPAMQSFIRSICGRIFPVHSKSPKTDFTHDEPSHVNNIQSSKNGDFSCNQLQEAHGS